MHADEGARALPLVPIARAAGAWLYDFDGRRYLDAISSWWVNLFGHAAPAHQRGDERPARPPRARDAGRLHPRAGGRALRAAGARLPAGRSATAFYASDGASAVEIALKMSFHYWRNAGRPDKRALRRARGRLPRRDPRRAFGHRRAAVSRRLRAVAAPGRECPARTGAPPSRANRAEHALAACRRPGTLSASKTMTRPRR